MLENQEMIEQEEKKGMLYRDAAIDERILRAVEEIGFETMTPIQEQAIPKMLEGKDIIGQAQTGTGKTAAFGIPTIQMADSSDRSLQALILCPTRELAIQAAEEMRRFAKYMHGIRILPIYGGQDINRQIKALKGGVQIVVGTPGRVMDHMRRHTLRTDRLKIMVLDEADEMLNMGFREDIETILKEVPENRMTALFSATMPKPILDITSTYQKPDAEYVKMTKQEITISLVKQSYYYVKRDQKEEILCRLMDYYQPKRSLIFCNTKKMVSDLAENLKARGYSAEGLHGDLSQYQRDSVMNSFRGGRTDILIATDVAARGIDVDNVEAVFNYDVPEDIEYYVHRIGRTGRAGKSGRSFTLVVGREIYKIRDIERLCKTRIHEKSVPSVKDITKVKADKIMDQVLQIKEDNDLSKTEKLLRDRLQREQETNPELTEMDIAVAFLRMHMGEELEEIIIEKESRDRRGLRDRKGGFHGDRRREGFGGGRHRDGDNSRGGRFFRERKEEYGRDKGKKALPRESKKVKGKMSYSEYERAHKKNRQGKRNNDK